MKKTAIISLCVSAILLSSCGEVAGSSQSETKTTTATAKTQSAESSEETTEKAKVPVSEVAENDAKTDVYYVTYYTAKCSDEGEKSEITDKEQIEKINQWIEKITPELDKYEVDGTKINYNGGDCITVTTQADVTDDVYFSDDYWKIDLTYVTIPKENVLSLVENGSEMANFSLDLNHNYMLPDEYIEEIYPLLTGKEITIENPLKEQA